jgi:NAD(P)-dependent dehydrogenase (short-subunit alcohol dehydrogenase family)
MDRLKETLALCGSEGLHAAFSLDLGNGEAIGDVLEFLKENAPIHGFVHAAGVSPTIPFKVMKPRQWEEAFQLNVFSAVQIMQLLTKVGIKSPDGMSMVLISSVMSEVGEKGKSLYAMTKAALIGMVKSLALEYADKGIRFNAISPSVVNSPLSEKSLYRTNDVAMQQVLDQHPLGLGEGDDIANAAIYLLSAGSRWVTGTNMVVDGGYLAR